MFTAAGFIFAAIAAHLVALNAKHITPEGLTEKMKHALQVRPSAIHGQGLFATRPINAGALLGVCNTVPTSKQGPYTLSRDEGDLLVTCRLRYINHSTNPNVAYYDDLSVVALRAIRAGDELTHDYGEEWAEQQRAVPQASEKHRA